MKEEELKALVNEANYMRGKHKEIDSEGLIEVDKEFLDQFMKAPSYLMINVLVIYFHTVIGGREAFQLMSSRLKKFQKSKAKEHNVYFNTLAWANREDRRQADLMQYKEEKMIISTWVIKCQEAELRLKIWYNLVQPEFI